jgi:hypothetical protein
MPVHAIITVTPSGRGSVRRCRQRGFIFEGQVASRASPSAGCAFEAEDPSPTYSASALGNAQRLDSISVPNLIELFSCSYLTATGAKEARGHRQADNADRLVDGQ